MPKTSQTIVQKGDPVLREIANPVPVEEISSGKIKNILSEMAQALMEQPDGVAIAAPQLGVSYRIFLIADRAYQANRKDRRFVFINPVITKHSKETKLMEEGCLSVRWRYGKTKRFKQATVEAYDETGKKFTFSGSGLLAQIFQHEIDHLDGVLFDDHAESLRDLTEDEIREYQKDINTN